MKLSPAMIEAMNKQIHLELSSAYVYLGMAAWCDGAHFRGSARWFRAQSKEEVEHAMKLYRFLTEYDARITLSAIAEPKAEYGSLLEAFEGALAHERMVSESIERLYEKAVGEKIACLEFGAANGDVTFPCRNFLEYRRRNASNGIGVLVYHSPITGKTVGLGSGHACLFQLFSTWLCSRKVRISG